MFTIALTLRLKPGAYPGYKSAHDQLWPEIARSMSDESVSMAIYRHGDHLFLFATAPDRAAWERSRAHPRLAEWDAQMTRFLEEASPGKIASERTSFDSSTTQRRRCYISELRTIHSR